MKQITQESRNPEPNLRNLWNLWMSLSVSLRFRVSVAIYFGLRISVCH